MIEEIDLSIIGLCKYYLKDKKNKKTGCEIFEDDILYCPEDESLGCLIIRICHKKNEEYSLEDELQYVFLNDLDKLKDNNLEITKMLKKKGVEKTQKKIFVKNL